MTTARPTTHEPWVDALRGWAALSVLIMHTFRQNLLPAFSLGEYASYLQADRAAVLLFFTLSGYVIGLSTRRPWTPGEARRYLWRRAVRILPVYLLAVALAWIAVPTESGRSLLGHLLFLQDSNADNPLHVAGLAGNTPLWSLHYEALFYVLFLAWWRWPASVGPSLGLAAVAAVWASASATAPGFVLSHAVGAIYWLAGLLLSRCGQLTLPNPAGRIAANLLWMHAVYHFAPVALLQAGLHLARETKTYMPLADLIYVPLCVTVLATAGSRRLPGARWWQWAAAGSAAAGLVMVLGAGKTLLELRWIVCTTYLAAGFFCFFRSGNSGLVPFAQLGRFSYALYALHFPLLMMLGRLLPDHLSNAAGMTVVLLGWLTVMPFSWWIEIRLQPALRAWLDPAAKTFPGCDRPHGPPAL